MEYWDLFDQDRRPLFRTHLRGRALDAGMYHVVVEIWTVRGNGEVLTTLRDPEKETWPGKWENTGGSAVAGETSRQAAVRELREETGIQAEESELVLLGTSRGNSAFHDTYALRRDLPVSALTLQPGETVDARWVALRELDAMAADGTLATPVAEGLAGVREALTAFLGEG